MSESLTADAATTDVPDDIRGAIGEAFAEHETPATPSSSPSPKSAEDETGSAASSSSADARPRATDGRFVKADEAPAPTGQPAATEAKPDATPQAPAPDFAKATANWSAADKAAADRLPTDMKDLLARRYGEMQADYTRKTQEVAQKAREWEPVDQLFAPHAEAMQQRGITKASMIQAWYGVERALMTGGDAAVNMIANIARGYKIDPSALARTLGVQPAGQAQQPDPGAPPPEGQQPIQLPPELQQKLSRYDQAIERLTQHEQDQQRYAYNQQAQRVVSAIEAFAGETDAAGAPKYPHFRDVETDMARLVAAYQGAGQAVPPLADLYDQAVWANPSTRQQIQASQRAADEAQRAEAARKQAEETRAKAEKARRAGSSVTGAPVASQSGRQATGSLREELEQALEGQAA